MSVFNMTFTFLRAFFRERLALAAENLALRQQLAVQQRSAKRPRLRRRDRIFWVWLSRCWRNWRSSVLIVKPDTVVRWHKPNRVLVPPLKVGVEGPDPITGSNAEALNTPSYRKVCQFARTPVAPSRISHIVALCSATGTPINQSHRHWQSPCCPRLSHSGRRCPQPA